MYSIETQVSCNGCGAVIHRDVSFVDLDMLPAGNICSATSINCAFIIKVNQLQDKALRLSIPLNTFKMSCHLELCISYKRSKYKMSFLKYLHI